MSTQQSQPPPTSTSGTDQTDTSRPSAPAHHLHSHIHHPPLPPTNPPQPQAHPTPAAPPPTLPPIPTLHPPELFSTLHPSIYRCTSLDTLTTRDFLRTLSLRTILLLGIEKPRPPLRHLCTSLSITLIHSALWLTTTTTAGGASSTSLASTTTTEPAWRQAVDEAMAYLKPEFRPILVVDAGGVFCGVVRRAVMRWNVTATVLEYRSFFLGGVTGGGGGGGGGGGRYGSEEVVELVGGEGWEVLEGLEDMVPRRRRRVGGRVIEAGNKEEEEEVDDKAVDQLAGRIPTAAAITV